MTTYTDRSQLVLMFGEVNLVKWSDIDNKKNTVDMEARITWAMDHAENYVNGRFALGRYATPFTSVPKIVTFMTTMYSGITLHDFFKMIVRPDKRDEVVNVRKVFGKYLREILTGQLKLVGLTSGEPIETTAYNAPSVSGVYIDVETILLNDQQAQLLYPCSCFRNLGPYRIIDGRAV